MPLHCLYIDHGPLDARSCEKPKHFWMLVLHDIPDQRPSQTAEPCALCSPSSPETLHVILASPLQGAPRQRGSSPLQVPCASMSEESDAAGRRRPREVATLEATRDARERTKLEAEEKEEEGAPGAGEEEAAASSLAGSSSSPAASSAARASSAIANPCPPSTPLLSQSSPRFLAVQAEPLRPSELHWCLTLDQGFSSSPSPLSWRRRCFLSTCSSGEITGFSGGDLTLKVLPSAPMPVCCCFQRVERKE